MAANNLLDTSTVSLSDILGNGKIYKVPAYQRDYSWKQDNWDDLWSDILAIEGKDIVHYMGSIVLQNNGEKKYSVIDGQQRLATLTLIILAVINALKQLVEQEIDKEKNEERIALLTKKFIGDKDPASLTYSSKLELNENNNSFFSTNLTTFRSPSSEKLLSDSDKLLWKAYSYFKDAINQKFSGCTKGEDLANFLNKEVAEKLRFIQIVVEDELSAYTVFETLNSRGERLTVTDLLKNYLFSITTKVDLKHVKKKWGQIIDTIGLDNFPTFLRHYWISYNKLVRHEYLFRALKNEVKTSTDVINLLEKLEENAQLYNALTNPSDSLWSGDKERKKRIRELKLFREKQALPLLIASYNNLNPEEFTKVLRIVSIITFRYTVVSKRHTNLKEDVYNKVAIKISSKELNLAANIAEDLKELYVADKDFKNTFSSLEVSTKGSSKKLARYILFGIENQMSGTDRDYEDDPATIEHILPENLDNIPENDWDKNFPISTQDAFIYRIGNYTLLEDDKNKACAIKPFDEKKNIYQQSQYKISQEIKTAEWTPDSLDRRQAGLSNIASSIWRLSYFD